MEQLRPAYLASFQLGTPDPMLSWFEGQQIVVRWCLKNDDFCGNSELQGVLSVRFCDYTTCEVPFTVRRHRGFWRYRLLGDEFFCKGGILSYKIELFRDANLICCSRHHLWADVIELNSDDESC